MKVGALGSRLSVLLVPQILSPHWYLPHGESFSASANLLRGRAQSCLCPDGTLSCLEICRCGINRFANEHLLLEVALECLSFRLGGTTCSGVYLF